MATVQQIGIPGVATGMQQPKLKNRWRVTFLGLGGGSSTVPVSWQATQCSRPKIDFDEVLLERYNSKAYVASKHTWSELSIQLEDDILSSASKVIQEQIQKQQYMTGIEGPWLATAPEGSVYKFHTILELLDGNETVLEKWEVQNCWLKGSDYGELDYKSGEQVTIALTLRYDHAVQTFGDYTGLGLAT